MIMSTPWSVVDSAERPSFEVMSSMESGFTLSCGELVRAGARAPGRVQQAWDEPPARGGGTAAAVRLMRPIRGGGGGAPHRVWRVV